ncbi:hypothetical protein GYMLUDRAFT_538302 [Collybiopsis luxurians FD-317 M1]|nr:hypothetical protein GYMLUDRAFT_538302 [Collybiopsis luxurians FD-317 M1]
MEDSVRAFVALQSIGAFFFLLVMLTAFLSPRVQRYATWYTFCISWIISCLGYTLIVVVNSYTAIGDGVVSDFPVGSRAWHVCLTQAALVYANPVLTGFTSLGMCLHVLLYIRAALKVPMLHVNAITSTLLAVIPYIIWIVMFISLFLVGHANPRAVEISPSGYYCHLELREPSLVSSGVAIIACIGVAAAETWMAIKVHRNRASLARTSQPLAFIIRVLLFCFVDLFTFVVGILFITHSTRNRGIFLLSLRLLIFGTQNDILQVWMFWRTSSQPETHVPVSTPTSASPTESGSITQHRPSLRTHRWRSSSQSYLDPSRKQITSNQYRSSQTSGSRTISVSIYQSTIVDDSDVMEKLDTHNRLDSSIEKSDSLNSPREF